MIKSFWTLFRGATFAAEQEALDRSALLLLDQHIRVRHEVTAELMGLTRPAETTVNPQATALMAR